MQQLRRFLRFWFGVQAAQALFAMFSLCVVMCKKGLVLPGIDLKGVDYNAFVGSVIGASLLMVVGDSVSGVAWWTLKKSKKSGRAWAIAASVLNLPIPFLSSLRASSIVTRFLHVPPEVVGTLIGVAGLIAFWPKEATATIDGTAKAAVRLAGDGTSKFQEHLAQGIAITILWLSFHWWSTWAAPRNLPDPGFVSFLVQFQLAILLTTLGHELGHLTAGWASREVLYSFRVGPFFWAIRNGKWRFDFNLRKFYGGAVGWAFPDLVNMRSRRAFSLMGGPVGSLVMGAVCIVATLLAPGRSWEPGWTLLSMMASLSIAGFVGNLIPQKTESNYSDGAQLYQVVTNGPWAQVHFAFAMVTTSLVTPLRPRDFDVGLLNRAAQIVPHGDRGLVLRLFACRHYLDTGQIEEALTNLQAAELLYDQSIFRRPEDICAEFVFVNALYKRDLAAAGKWWQRIEARGKVEKDADYWRARTALLWLKGEREEANECWERGSQLASKLPASGAYDGTRLCFAELRRRLDEPTAAVPPPLYSSNDSLRPLSTIWAGDPAPVEV